VELLVPAGIYHGVGTYPCGSEAGKSIFEASYCTIVVDDALDATTRAKWSTEHLARFVGRGTPAPILAARPTAYYFYE
jgi:hypothetical protein